MPFPLARKLFHSAGVIVVALYWGLDLERATAAWLLGGAVVLLGLVDLARARLPAVQALFLRSFRGLLDEKDAAGLNTSTLYFAGCFLAVLIAPQPAACGGILALALGDPAAALVGMNVRSPRIGKSASLAGTAACFVCATLAAGVFMPWWPAAVAGGAAAAVLEAYSGAKLDNLTIPAGTAWVLSVWA